jgi:tyrosyl-tRNA synthetase
MQDMTNPALEKATATETLTVYCGFDPTAESLHLGNLLGIIVLTWFQRYGHKPVALLGGATGRVGDPSGLTTLRTAWL